MENFLKSFNNNAAGSAFSNLSSLYGPKKKPTTIPGATLNDFLTPNSKLIPNNIGATAAVPTPKPTIASSPAKSAYVDSLTSTEQPGVSSVQPSYVNPNASFQIPTGGSVGTPSPQTPSPSSLPDKNQAYKDAYTTYIQSLNPSDDVISATKNLNDLQLQAQKDQETALGRGETLGFASGEAARVNKNNSFGIDAASNALNALTGQRTATTNAAKARADFEKGLLDSSNNETTASKPFEVGGSTYQLNPETGKYEITATAPASGSAAGFTLSPGETRYDAQGNAIASGGPKPLSQAQETAQIANAEKETAAQQSATQSIGLVNNLLSGGAYKSITGVGQNPFNFLNLANGATRNQYNQLQGLLKLGIRGLIKGQGAISDYEGKILGQAASALGRNLNNADFEQQLKKIRGVLQTNNGGTASVVVKDKNGKVLGQGDLTGQDIYEAVNDGATVEYL